MKTKEEFVKCSKCNGSGEEWYSPDSRLFPKISIPCSRCGGSGWISINSIFKTIKGWIEGMKKNTFKIIMVVSVIFLIAMSINIAIKLHEIHESVIQIKSSISDIQRDSGEIAGMIRDVQGTGTVK